MKKIILKLIFSFSFCLIATSASAQTTIQGSQITGGAGAGVGTITSVIAGTGLNGGGSTGAVTLNLTVPVPVTSGGTGVSSAPSLTGAGGITISGTWPNQTITCSSCAGTTSFSSLLAGTNTSQALVVGNGSSIHESGTGIVDANYILTYPGSLKGTLGTDSSFPTANALTNNFVPFVDTNGGLTTDASGPIYVPAGNTLPATVASYTNATLDLGTGTYAIQATSYPTGLTLPDASQCINLVGAGFNNTVIQFQPLTATPTAYSSSGTSVTFTASNSFTTSQVLAFKNLTGYTALNNQAPVPITAASPTSFTVTFSGATGSGSESGSAFAVITDVIAKTGTSTVPNGCVIKDLTVDMNYAATSGLYITNMTNARVENVKFINISRGSITGAVQFNGNVTGWHLNNTQCQMSSNYATSALEGSYCFIDASGASDGIETSMTATNMQALIRVANGNNIYTGLNHITGVGGPSPIRGVYATQPGRFSGFELDGIANSGTGFVLSPGSDGSTITGSWGINSAGSTANFASIGSTNYVSIVGNDLSGYASNTIASPIIFTNVKEPNINTTGNTGDFGEIATQTSSIGITGTTFTASGCGTPTSLKGGATAGEFRSGITGTCTVVITFGNTATATNGWYCPRANDFTNTSDFLQQTAYTTTTVTLSGTTVSNDLINFACIAY